VRLVPRSCLPLVQDCCGTSPVKRHRAVFDNRHASHSLKADELVARIRLSLRSETALITALRPGSPLHCQHAKYAWKTLCRGSLPQLSRKGKRLAYPVRTTRRVGPASAWRPRVASPFRRRDLGPQAASFGSPRVVKFLVDTGKGEVSNMVPGPQGLQTARPTCWLSTSGPSSRKPSSISTASARAALAERACSWLQPSMPAMIFARSKGSRCPSSSLRRMALPRGAHRS